MPFCVDRLRLVHSTGRRYAESVARGGLTYNQKSLLSSAWTRQLQGSPDFGHG